MSFPQASRDDALADLITNTWVRKIREFDAPDTDLESIQEEIAWARELMRAANWPAVYQHEFFSAPSQHADRTDRRSSGYPAVCPDVDH